MASRPRKTRRTTTAAAGKPARKRAIALPETAVKRRETAGSKTAKKPPSTSKRSTKNTAPLPANSVPRTTGQKPGTVGAPLIPPANGVVVRMYRIGHGDCFLLAFHGDTAPVYVLIDCGYKPGSSRTINTSAKQVTDDIKAATGGRIDVMVITHEHQDHVNGITRKNFEGLEIGEAWFAWTEDGSDELANRLRKRFNDQLLGIVRARRGLALALGAAAATDKTIRRIDELLALEIGGETDPTTDEIGMDGQLAAHASGGTWGNKRAMELVRQRAAENNGVKYLRPHEPARQLPGAKEVRVLTLGPPRDEALLDSLDPRGTEEFHLSAFAAAESHGATTAQAPFDGRYGLPIGKPFVDTRDRNFFDWFYKRGHKLVEQGVEGDGSVEDDELPPEAAARADRGRDEDEAPTDADWRRIDSDWLRVAEQLALDMNSKTNNGSLVLAFELGKGGKVLLFTADAQRGNWVSWTKGTWRDGRDEVTARDLLARTVLLKVGHHGSHNATLSGGKRDEYPNLAWMAANSDCAREFTAMITAVRAWAEKQAGWDHPFAPIRKALVEKTGGRVFQTDRAFDLMLADRPTHGGEDWASFERRTSATDLYFDYIVE